MYCCRTYFSLEPYLHELRAEDPAAVLSQMQLNSGGVTSHTEKQRASEARLSERPSVKQVMNLFQIHTDVVMILST